MQKSTSHIFGTAVFFSIYLFIYLFLFSLVQFSRCCLKTRTYVQTQCNIQYRIEICRKMSTEHGKGWKTVVLCWIDRETTSSQCIKQMCVCACVCVWMSECMCVWICEWCAWKVWIKIGRSYGCITAHNVRKTPTFNIVRMIPSVQYTLIRWAIQTLTTKTTADGAHWTCF